MKIVVIGSGFGGLAAAVRLQAQGHRVIVLEKRDKPGGRAYVYKQDGYTFDGGPTIITAPWLIDELYDLAGKKSSDYIDLVKLDPFYNIRFPDGTVFNYNDDNDQLLGEIHKFSPADVDGYKRFAKDLGEIYKVGFDLIDQPFETWQDMVKLIPKMIRLRSDRSVYKFASRYFTDDRLRQAFSFHPLLIGGNPFTATSIYAMIHRLEQEYGVWFAKGGTGTIVKSLCNLFLDLGGEIYLKATAEKIAIDRRGRATGVYIHDEDFILKEDKFLQADAVVCNADVACAYLNLVPPENRTKYTDEKIKGMTYSMSLFVYYFGTDKKYENMAHHEIILGERYEGLLGDIFKRKILADDFSLYLHRPTATDSSLAPEGCDSFYVLSPVPHLEADIDWKTESPRYRDRIIDFLESNYMPGLSQHIVTDHYIDPLHFQGELNSYLGSAFSVEPTLMQSAFLRPHNRSEDVENLYFVGAGTHPGAGLPGVLSSGKIVANMIGASDA
jgi:phytoene desaturase